MWLSISPDSDGLVSITRTRIGTSWAPVSDGDSMATRVADMFPITEKTSTQWSKLALSCGNCSAALDLGRLSGSLERLRACTEIHASGECGACGAICTLSMRLNRDGTVSELRQGQWTAYRLRRGPAVWMRHVRCALVKLL